jgi:hypothetical protein
VLLGTKGGPAVRSGYTPSPSANLIVYNGVPYVIDTGYGVSFNEVQKVLDCFIRPLKGARAPWYRRHRLGPRARTLLSSIS